MEKIDNGATPVQGMTHGFAIRYGLVGDSMVALKDWNAFPCISINDKAYDDDDNTNDEEELCYESYACRVFNGIIQVRAPSWVEFILGRPEHFEHAICVNLHFHGYVAVFPKSTAEL
jgi:hypothetical protein